jgi:hypothetical protein
MTILTIIFLAVILLYITSCIKRIIMIVNIIIKAEKTEKNK